MPTYITLFRWTQKGIERVKDSPARLDKVKKAVTGAGGKFHGFYMTMGQYDGVTITEAPSDEAYAKIILAAAAGGSIQVETLRAFTEEEYRKIVGSVG
jgi:uncharacterized protein with GYD domain